MRKFYVRFYGKVYEFRLCKDGYLWFRDEIGAWTNANQRLLITSLSSAKFYAREMLISIGY